MRRPGAEALSRGSARRLGVAGPGWKRDDSRRDLRGVGRCRARSGAGGRAACRAVQQLARGGLDAKLWSAQLQSCAVWVGSLSTAEAALPRRVYRAGAIVEAASSLGPCALNVLVRPRAGDFLYSDLEFQVSTRFLLRPHASGRGLPVPRHGISGWHKAAVGLWPTGGFSVR